MKIKGIHHLKLTVSNLKRSRIFYEKLPGFRVVAAYPHFIMFYNGYIYLGITDHEGKLQEKKFSEYNIGMDHAAFAVESRHDLDQLLIFLDENNILHGEIKMLSNDQHVLSFRDPDNIQLEFVYKG